MFKPPVNCAAWNVQRAARTLTQRYDAALAPAGITSAQFTLLNHVAAGTHTVGTIAEAVGLDGSTATRNLRLLADGGYIALEADSDRRRRVARLLPPGRAALRAAAPLWRAVQSQTVRRFGARRFRQFVIDLQAVSARAADD